MKLGVGYSSANTLFSEIDLALEKASQFAKYIKGYTENTGDHHPRCSGFLETPV